MTKKPTKYFSNLQETRIALLLGWSTVIASGARDFKPGDIQSESWLGECKTHTKSNNKITFNLAVWKKLMDEASYQFKLPALFVDDGSQDIKTTWVMFNNGLDLSNIAIEQLPIKFQTNLSFHHLELNKWDGVYRFKFGDTFVYLTKLSVFQQLLQGGW